MGIRSLFGLSKSTTTSPSSQTPGDGLPSLSTEIPKLPSSEKWQGNLPCVHGTTDGCASHNPAQTTIFFDKTLFGSSASKIKPSGNVKTHDPLTQPDDVIIPTITSDLPRTDDALIQIPRVHKSVPYSLSFYHIHASMQDPSRLLACRATTGSNPSLSWEVKPLVVQRPANPDSDQRTPLPLLLLLEYSLAFVVKADLGTWSESTQHGRAISKELLIGSGYRDFHPCPHTQLAFTSHRGEGKDHTRYAGVNFTRKIQRPGPSSSTKWNEQKVEWRSEADDTSIEPLCCGKCYTDVTVDFTMMSGGAVVVSVGIYKDLGEGRHWADPKWLAAARGVEVRRGEEDFGRMKRAFVDAGLSL